MFGAVNDIMSSMAGHEAAEFVMMEFVLLWSEHSLLCCDSSMLECQCLFCDIVCWKYVTCFFFHRSSWLRHCHASLF